VNRGTLPILARLHSLQAAPRILPGGGRVIAEMQDRNPLAQLLRAVNETMLGRSLEFVSSAGQALSLDVAGRRVLRLTASHGLPGAESCLGVEVLEDEHKDDLIKLLQAVAAPRHELSVISGPLQRGGAEVSVGLPVALLADLLLIDLNQIGPGDPLPEEDLVEAPVAETTAIQLSGKSLHDLALGIGPTLVAWLILGGEDSGLQDGPEDMVSHLQGFLDDEHDTLTRQLDLLSLTPGAPICLMLGVTLIEGHNILCARLQDTILLGVIEADGLQAALAAWTALLH
jgi:hypothetical protein